MAVDLADLERLRMVLLGSRAHTVAEAMIEIEALRNELAELRTHSAHLADELATATEMLENGAIAAREERLVAYRNSAAVLLAGQSDKLLQEWRMAQFAGSVEEDFCDFLCRNVEAYAHAMLAAERPAP